MFIMEFVINNCSLLGFLDISTDTRSSSKKVVYLKYVYFILSIVQFHKHINLRPTDIIKHN